jgi:hypothetical protein
MCRRPWPNETSPSHHHGVPLAYVIATWGQGDAGSDQFFVRNVDLGLLGTIDLLFYSHHLIIIKHIYYDDVRDVSDYRH